MNPRILLLRPEPGAAASAAAARALGLEPVVAPLFTIRALDWVPPDPAGFDGVLLTSANAARQGGAGLALYAHLPCHAVGERTAQAAREAGFAAVRAGPGDAAALLDEVVSRRRSGQSGNSGVRSGPLSLLHLCGRDHIAAEREGLLIARVPVYAAEAAQRLDDRALEAVRDRALVLLHSPRAAALFAKLVDESGISRDTVAIAAISAAALQAAGGGWAQVAAAAAPQDEKLLALAARLSGVKD